jgi:adenylate cyclase
MRQLFISKPAEEDLTFLFIDLRSSTSIAERMGHIQYSRFIESCFEVLTDIIYSIMPLYTSL